MNAKPITRSAATFRMCGLKAGDLVRYRNTSESEEEEWESQWDRIKDFMGIVLPRDPRESRPHVRIMWNTGEIMIHLIPLYEEEHFEVIDEEG